MATCVRNNVRRATLAGTPSRLMQAGARHRECAELTAFFLSSPLISAIAVLPSSPPSSMSSLSTIVDATTAASTPPSSFLLSTPSPFLFTSPPSLAFFFSVLRLHRNHDIASLSSLLPFLRFRHQPSTIVTLLRCSIFLLPFPSPTVPPSTSSLIVDFLYQHHPPPLRLSPSAVPATHRRSPPPLPSSSPPCCERHCRSLPCSSTPTTITSAASALSSFSAFSLHFALHPGEAISIFVHRHGLLDC